MKTIILAMGLLTVASVWASDADKGGNGGGAHYCKKPDGKFLSIESFDLYEGKTRHRMTIPKWDKKTTKEEYLSRALKKLEGLHLGMAEAARNVLKHMDEPNVIIPLHGVRLKPSGDANEYYIGENCEYRQVINWLDIGWWADEVMRDVDTYAKLDPLSQAALDLHEAIYKTVRFYWKDQPYTQEGTEDIRYYVAFLFSTNTEKPIHQGDYDKLPYWLLRQRLVEQNISLHYLDNMVPKVEGDRGIGDDGGDLPGGLYSVMVNMRGKGCDPSMLTLYLTPESNSSSDPAAVEATSVPRCENYQTELCSGETKTRMEFGKEYKFEVGSFGTWSDGHTFTKDKSSYFSTQAVDAKGKPLSDSYRIIARIEGCGIKSGNVWMTPNIRAEAPLYRGYVGFNIRMRELKF